jgi:nucleotide-binding universal stress UspA family protein
MVEYVSKVARRFRFRVTLFHAIEESIVIHVAGGYDVSGLVKSLEDSARKKLAEYKKRLEEAGVTVDIYPDIPVADPGVAIPEAAKEAGASEIFIASKGLGLSRVIPLGSTVHIAIKLSSIPVVRFKVSRGEKGQASIQASENPFSKILVGIDENVSKEMIEYAMRLAAKSRGSLIFVHVIEHGDTVSPHVRNAFNVISRLAEVYKVSPEEIVVTGNPAKLLVQLATQLDASAILLGRTVTKSFEELILGSTLDRVLKLAAQPVIVYPL